MSTSDYDEIEGYENRILFWLRLDKWYLHQAALLFIDINPDTVGSDFYSLITLREVKYNDFDNSIEMLELRSKYDDLRRILSFSANTPQGWIDLALSKKIAIPWLEFAIREGFYKTEKTTIDEINSKNKTLSTRTENNYLRLILTLANEIEGFNPRKPYEAAQLIIDATEIDISQQTISDYIKKAYEIESQKRD